MAKCKYSIEEITTVYNAHTNRTEKPSLHDDKFRIVRQCKTGFKVISSHQNKEYATKKLKSLTK